MIKIDEKEYQRILEIDKKNRNKRVDQKLRVLKLRYEGASNREISLRTGYNERYVTKLMGDYAKQGLEEFLRIKHTSHYRLLSENEEAEILAGIEKEAEAGTVLTIGDITAAFEEKLGRKASKTMSCCWSVTGPGGTGRTDWRSRRISTLRSSHLIPRR